MLLLSQDFRLCEMTLQLKVMIKWVFFILKRLISCCRHLRTVMSELVPARERTNTSEPIMLSILLNTTSMSVNSSL